MRNLLHGTIRPIIAILVGLTGATAALAENDGDLKKLAGVRHVVAFESKKQPAFAKHPPAYRLQSKPTHQIEAELTMDIRYPKMAAEEWSVHVAMLPEQPGQKNVATEMDPPGKATTDLSDHKRPILSARVPVKGDALKTGIKIRLTYRADLFARELVPLEAGMKPPAVPELSDAERKLALAPTTYVNFNDPALQAWLDKHALRPRDKESDVDFARRVFLVIRKNFTYAIDPKDERHAAAVCKLGRSECGGLSFLYTAALRANGIPARVLIGRFARPGDKGMPIKIGDLEITYGGQHATTEFHAHGVGWVPADTSAGIVYDKSAAGLDYFGRDQGAFLTQHIDDDVILDAHFVGRQNTANLQSPAVWCNGAGSYDDQKRIETWEVRKRP